MPASKYDVVNRVVAYRSDTDPVSRCGLVIGVEGDSVRLFEYAPVSDASEHIAAVEKEIAAEEAIIASCEMSLQQAQTETDERRDLAGSPGEDGKLQLKWLQWAKDGLARVTAADLQRIAVLPPSAAGSATEVVCTAVAVLSARDEGIADWGRARAVFADPALIDTLCQLDAKPVPQALQNVVQSRFYTSPLFSFSEAAKCSKATGVLYKWLTAFMDYQRSAHPGGADIELQQRLDGSGEALELAKLRRLRLREDLRLTQQGMLHRRTNRIKVALLTSVVKVVAEPSLRLGREFVIRGLANLDSDQELAIVNRTPRLPQQEQGRGGLFVSVGGGASSRSGGASWRRSSVRSGTDSDAGHAAALRPSTRASLRTSAGASEASQGDLAPPPATAAAAPTPAPAPAVRPAISPRLPVARQLRAPSPSDATPDATPSPRGSPPALDTAGLCAENVELRERLAAAEAAHQRTRDQSREQLLSLHNEFFRVVGAHKGLLEDYRTTQEQHEALEDNVYLLIDDHAASMEAWQRERGDRRRQLLLCKALIAMLRVANAGAAAAGGSGVAANDNLFAATSDAGFGVEAAEESAQMYTQDSLMNTAEFLRGVMAVMDLPPTY